MLTATGIKKSIGKKPTQVDILHGISMEINSGEMLAIMGPSGCGKSTLLAILSGLDEPNEGKVVIDNQDIYALSDDARDSFRSRNIGVVFQSSNLISELNCVDNVSVPWLFAHNEKGGAKQERIKEVLNMVGLDGKEKRYPYQLSGGEQQRAAVARALLMRPKILFADEPTGSLDQENSLMLMRIFRDSVKGAGHTAVLVTHDHEVAAQCDRIIRMRDGLLAEV